MIKKQNLASLIIIVGLFIATSVMADNSTSTPVSATSTAGSVLGLRTPLIPPIIGQIKEAKIKLSTISLNHQLIPVYRTVRNAKTGKVSNIVSKYTLGDKDIALAILEPTTGNISVTIGRQNGKTMVFPDKAVDVKLTKFNGVNSKFQINNPTNGQVVALKYLISPKESGGKGAIENSLSEALYVPYSPALSTPDVAKYGANYLANIVSKVTAELQNFPSQAIPGQTVTEAIPPAMIKALIYAEHTDTASVLYGNDTQGTIDQLNITFALNEGDTYKYSVSTASARGIAQFIPSTYQSLVNRHPNAGFIGDFVTAMADHQNSIKAMYLLLDDYAGAVRVKGAQGFAVSRVFDYGAASYNGGTTRVAKAVNEFGPAWNLDRSAEINGLQNEISSLKSKIKKANKKTTPALKAQLADDNSKLATIQSATLRNETVNYLAKIYKVIQYFNEQQLAMK